MNDYKRDSNTGALFFCNKQKEAQIMETRSLHDEIVSMRSEIDTMKRLLNQLIVERN